MTPSSLLPFLLWLTSICLCSHVGFVRSTTLRGPTNENAVPSALPLVRIPLENYNQLQFYGKLQVGTPSQEFHVMFDTGSSDTWIVDEACQECSGTRRFHAKASRSLAVAEEDQEEKDPVTFEENYGTGHIAGTVIRDTVRLGELEFAQTTLGSVRQQAANFQKLPLEGLVGLGFDDLAHINSRSVLDLVRSNENYQLPMVFSLFLSAQPQKVQSQLVFGGVDEKLAGPNASWVAFDVVPTRQGSYGFWKLPLNKFLIAGQQIELSDRVNAMVDSGTSLILLPTKVFDQTVALIASSTNALVANNGLLFCSSCSARDFPPLAFEFGNAVKPSAQPRQFVLQGSDYVECDSVSDTCVVLLDKTTTPFVILGNLFLRVYYTRFDVDTKQVAFACPHGRCSGGFNPPLMLNVRSVSEWVYVIDIARYICLVGCLVLIVRWVHSSRITPSELYPESSSAKQAQELPVVQASEAVEEAQVENARGRSSSSP